MSRDVAVDLSLLAATAPACLAGPRRQAWWLGAGFAVAAAPQTACAIAAANGPLPAGG